MPGNTVDLLSSTSKGNKKMEYPKSHINLDFFVCTDPSGLFRTVLDVVGQSKFKDSEK